MKRLLGPDGKPIKTARQAFAAQYDVGETSNQDSEHWSRVGIGDANIAYDYNARVKTRDRARYETANNCHLRGMVNTKASDVIGKGPNLQMGSQHQKIEQAWKVWAEEINLSDKLMTMWGPGKMQDGEALAFLFNNEFLDNEVQLDIMPIEGEQMGNPLQMADTETMYDGIRHMHGVPYEYYIYDNHPNTYAAYETARTAPYLGQWYPSRQVIHVFRKYRAGQLRGATELGAALPMSAVIRRYTLATLTSAETAASISLWLETDGMPEEQPEILDQSTFPLFRNQVIAAPYRWKIHQMRAEQPVDTYDKFLRAIITQMGRSIGMPAALSYGDSSEYNMASGRLDYQDYIRGVNTERKLYLETQCVDKIFYAWLILYLTRGGRAPVLEEDISIAALRANYPHRWAYEPIHHSDPEKQASADVAKYNAGHITLFDVLHEQNKDPEQHFLELKEQTKRLSEIGMPAPGMMPGMPTAGQSGGPSNGQPKQNGQASSQTN